MMNNLSLGRWGEKIAVKYLSGKGYQVIETNFHKRWGEIDIIAREKETLVFIEVKTRMIFDTISPEESIAPWKIKKVQKTALYYKNLHPELPELLRIDFLGVVLNDNYRVERINLVRNISPL